MPEGERPPIESPEFRPLSAESLRRQLESLQSRIEAARRSPRVALGSDRKDLDKLLGEIKENISALERAQGQDLEKLRSDLSRSLPDTKRLVSQYEVDESAMANTGVSGHYTEGRTQKLSAAEKLVRETYEASQPQIHEGSAPLAIPRIERADTGTEVLNRLADVKRELDQFSGYPAWQDLSENHPNKTAWRKKREEIEGLEKALSAKDLAPEAKTMLEARAKAAIEDADDLLFEIRLGDVVKIEEEPVLRFDNPRVATAALVETKKLVRKFLKYPAVKEAAEIKTALEKAQEDIENLQDEIEEEGQGVDELKKRLARAYDLYRATTDLLDRIRRGEPIGESAAVPAATESDTTEADMARMENEGGGQPQGRDVAEPAEPVEPSAAPGGRGGVTQAEMDALLAQSQPAFSGLTEEDQRLIEEHLRRRGEPPLEGEPAGKTEAPASPAAPEVGASELEARKNRALETYREAERRYDVLIIRDLTKEQADELGDLFDKAWRLRLDLEHGASDRDVNDLTKQLEASTAALAAKIAEAEKAPIVPEKELKSKRDEVLKEARVYIERLDAIIKAGGMVNELRRMIRRQVVELEDDDDLVAMTKDAIALRADMNNEETENELQDIEEKLALDKRAPETKFFDFVEATITEPVPEQWKRAFAAFVADQAETLGKSAAKLAVEWSGFQETTSKAESSLRSNQLGDYIKPENGGQPIISQKDNQIYLVQTGAKAGEWEMFKFDPKAGFVSVNQQGKESFSQQEVKEFLGY